MGNGKKEDSGNDRQFDRGIKQSQKRSNRHQSMKSLQEWMDISNSDDDLDDYIDDEEIDYE